VKAYQQAEKGYFEKAQKVIVAVNELNDKTATVCALIDKFLEQVNNPVGILRGLTDEPALSDLSLSKFLNGEIAEETAEENGRFLDELATRYAEIARRLPEIKTARESLETLADHLDSINTEANSLVRSVTLYRLL
jgi:hypothetical protein